MWGKSTAATVLRRIYVDRVQWVTQCCCLRPCNLWVRPPLPPSHYLLVLSWHLPWGYFIAFSQVGQGGKTFGWLHQKLAYIANWALSLYGKFANVLKITFVAIVISERCWKMQYFPKLDPIYIVLRASTPIRSIYIDTQMLRRCT